MSPVLRSAGARVCVRPGSLTGLSQMEQGGGLLCGSPGPKEELFLSSPSLVWLLISASVHPDYG